MTLSKPWTETVTVQYVTSNGSAVAPGDYASTGDTVTFAPGQTTATIVVGTNSDDMEEGNENFNISLSAPTNATIADGAGVVTIIDDFTPPPVVDPNLAPVAVDDTASTEADTPVDINVLPNDSDPDGDAISITGFTQPTNGSVVQNPDGTFTYTPDTEFSGSDSFTYTITDGEFSSTADVNIVVADNPIEIGDENPLANGIQRVLDEALLPGDTQANPDALNGESSFDVTSKDGLSSLIVNGEELIDDDGTLLEGTIVTDSGDHVQVTFTSMDGPTADGVYTVNYEVTLIKPFANDPGSDSVDVDFVIAALDTDGDPAGPVTRSATIRDDNPIANDDTNGILPEDEGLISGDVFLGDASGGVADLPGADGAAVSSISFIGEDIGVEKDVTDAGTNIAGDYGDLTIKSDGTYEYQLNQAGQDAILALGGEETIEEQFTYVLTDGDDDSDPATLTITLDGRNDPPDAIDDDYETNEDTPLTIFPAGVLINDSDQDGDLLTVTDNTDPENGTVTLNSDGSFEYTPNDNFNGVDAFEYTISDGKGGTDTAKVQITVNSVNDLSDLGESITTPEDTPVSADANALFLNTLNPDGDALSVTQFTWGTNVDVVAGNAATIAGVGTLLIGANGSYTFTPADDYDGAVPSATYDVTDTFDTVTSSLAIAITPANDLSDLGESITTPEDTPVSADANALFLNTLNPDGDALSVTQFTWGTNVDVVAGNAATIDGVGTLLIGANGSYTFTPADDYDGAVPSATYDVTDTFDTVTSSLAIAITPANDLSDLGESITTPEDTPVSADANALFLNTLNPDGDALSVTQFTWGTNVDVVAGNAATIAGVGTLLIGANGSYTFTPADDYDGAVPSATYDVTDTFDTVTSSLAIAITPANDLSDLGESITTPEDTPVSADANALFLNTLNPDGDALSVTQFTWGTNVDVVAGNAATIAGVGTLLIGANGSYTFTPADDYDGAVPSATYDVTDTFDTVTSSLAIAITPANDPPEIDMSQSGMDVDEGHLIIGNDYVDPQTSDPQTTDTGSIVFKTGDQPFTLNIGSATFTSLAAIMAASGATIGTEHGTLTFGSLTGPVDGEYTLAYSYQLDEAEDHSTNDADPGQDNILVTLVDNEGSNVGDQYITVGIVDDKPVGFDPDSAFVVDGSGVASDIPLNFANSVGADDLGFVVFTPIAGDNTAKDINGNILKIDGKPLFFYTSDDGLELTVATANPYDGIIEDGGETVALTFNIVGDTYTLTSNNGVISNGTDLSNADLSGVRGGNSEDLLLIDAFESSSNSLLDVLATGVGNSTDNTVNSNDFSMGVGAGNDVDFKGAGDVLTLEFVTGLSDTDEFGDPETTYDSRVGVNNFKLPLLNVRNDATFTLTLYNGDASPENLVGTLEYDTTTDGLVIPDSVDAKIDNYFIISTEENFTTVVIEATAGNFKVGQFSLTEFVEGQPVNLSIGVTGLDSDDIDQPGGDSVEGTIDVTVQAANDNLIDASSDPLTGTTGDDIFIWELADATAENDVVVGFGAEGNDILDLRDILQLEDSGAPGEIGNLDSYLSISLDGLDTVIEVSSVGSFTGVADDVNLVDQTITLQNVDLVTGNGDLEGIIQNMMETGKLITD